MAIHVDHFDLRKLLLTVIGVTLLVVYEGNVFLYYSVMRTTYSGPFISIFSCILRIANYFA